METDVLEYEEYCIDLIKGLAKSYVSQKECLSLLTISMNGNNSIWSKVLLTI